MAQICDRCYHKTPARVYVDMTMAPITPLGNRGESGRLANYDLCNDCLTALTREMKNFMNPPQAAGA